VSGQLERKCGAKDSVKNNGDCLLLIVAGGELRMRLMSPLLGRRTRNNEKAALVERKCRNINLGHKTTKVILSTWIRLG
jgi:hypothetical protein